MKKLLKPIFLLTPAIAACLALASCALSQNTYAQTVAVPDGQHMFYASHSLMWDVPPPLAEMVNAYGITNHTLSIQRMGFSRTQAFWDQPEAQSQAKQALKAGNLDDFVMSPMDMPDNGVAEFVKLGILNNPHMRFFVQNNWAGFNNDGQKAQQSMQLMMSGRLKSWDQTTEEELKTLKISAKLPFPDDVIRAIQRQIAKVQDELLDAQSELLQRCRCL